MPWMWSKKKKQNQKQTNFEFGFCFQSDFHGKMIHLFCSWSTFWAENYKLKENLMMAKSLSRHLLRLLSNSGVGRFVSCLSLANSGFICQTWNNVRCLHLHMAHSHKIRVGPRLESLESNHFEWLRELILWFLWIYIAKNEVWWD